MQQFGRSLSFQPSELPGSVVIDVAGSSVELQSEAGCLREAAVGLFRRALVTSISPRFLIRLIESPIAQSLSNPDQVIAGVATKFAKDSIELGADGLVVSVSENEILLTGRSSSPAPAVRRLLIPALTYLFALHDRFLIHAGSLVMNDSATLVIGSTGSGKSTAIASALAAGFTVMGDDVVAVEIVAGELTATAFPRPISIDQNLFQGGLLDRRFASSKLVDGDSRDRIELTVATGSLDTYPVGGLIRVGHSSAEVGELRALDRLAAAQELVASSLAVANASTRAAYMSVVARLSQLPAWELLHGNDGANRISNSGRLLQEVNPLAGVSSQRGE